MARRLPDYVLTDFTPGVVLDRSDYTRPKGSVPELLNMDVDERGRLRKRRGFYRWGGSARSADGAFYSDFLGAALSPDVAPPASLYVTKANPAVAYYRNSTTLTVAATVATTTLTVADTTNLSASGTVEVDGDEIAYTGKGATTLTGVTGIRVPHPIGCIVNQWGSAVTPSVTIDSTSGLYGTRISNKLILTGLDDVYYTDTHTGSNLFPIGGASVFFGTAYRGRVFGAGSGDLNGTNAQVNRVAFSDAGDPTTWNADNYFEVEDELHEMVTGLRVYQDRLVILKQNSLHTYDEVQLKQRLYGVGAYNHFCVQNIRGRMYTFCPTGVHVTNSVSAEKISAPVDHYLRAFVPQYDTTRGRVITNCFSGQFENKYLLYLGTLRFPTIELGHEVLNGVCLVYDTVKRNWTVYTDFHPSTADPFTQFVYQPSFFAGSVSTRRQWQGTEALFGISATGVYRLFENKNFGTAAVNHGGAVLSDNVANSAGRPIPTRVRTGMLYQGLPGWWKQHGFLRVLVGEGDFNVRYRLDLGNQLTEWRTLGRARTGNTRFRIGDEGEFTENQGYGIEVEATSNSTSTRDTLEGLILEEVDALDRQNRDADPE